MLIEIFEKIVANLGEFDVKSCNSKVRVRASTEVATLKVRLLICYLPTNSNQLSSPDNMSSFS